MHFDPDEPLADYPQLPPNPPGTFQAFCEGFWTMLEPLAQGTHTIHFQATVVLQATYPNVDAFETEVTYHLTVE